MDLLGAYDSNSGGEDNVHDETVSPSPKVQRPDRRFLRAAPEISILTRRKHGNELIVRSDPSNQQLLVTEPLQGPQLDDPRGNKNQLALVGKIERNTFVDPTSFAKERKKFQRTGMAVGPDEKTTVVRTTLGYNANRLRQFNQIELERERQQRELYGDDDEDNNDDDNEANKTGKKRKKAKEPLVYGSDDEAVYGVWAPPSKEERWNADNSLTLIQKSGLESLEPEQLAEREYIKERDRLLGAKEEEEEEVSGFERLMERKMAHLLPPKVAGDDQPMEPTKTTFHGESEMDYKGRSWMAPPSGMSSILSLSSSAQEQMDDHKCFVPKKCVHRYTGHNKGVQRIRMFPKTGHLLLSAGLDGKCKIWSVGGVGERKVMRTYEGHKAAVRDVQFNHDGTRFVSASFDRFLRLWDTETGKVLQTFGNKKVPYCVEFYPKDDNYFVVGCSDNKIVTYDATTGEITQEYNHHLAPINSIVFVEDDNGTTKMISSSDDKKVLVWEWDIGVPIKYISDPTMHSMPSLVMHPSQKFFVGQSLDNNIVCFQVGQKFKLSKKKKFSGHQVAGYACEPAFSPDGRFLVSGDGKGRIFFWDWKMQKTLQKYKAHDSGPAIACVWHPREPSVMFTCGWDGVIKMWQ
jgi:pre-mRNA-processing factor 17